MITEISAYDLGYASGYNDECPDCPYQEESPYYDEWWRGYQDGSDNS